MKIIRKIILFIYVGILPWDSFAANVCANALEQVLKANLHQKFEYLNDYMLDPEYKVLFFVRHGHAVQENKEKVVDPLTGNMVHGPLDRSRELDKKGKKRVAKLANFLSDFEFSNTVVMVSDALRVRQTGQAIYDGIKSSEKNIIVDPDLYYVEDVRGAIFERLQKLDAKDLRHAIYVGHGKSTMAAFKHFTGSEEAFNPTSGVMAIAVKTPSWDKFNSEEHFNIQVFAWSPKESHQTGLAPANAE